MGDYCTHINVQFITEHPMRHFVYLPPEGIRYQEVQQSRLKCILSVKLLFMGNITGNNHLRLKFLVIQLFL
uniref:Uncharacterized protein n=1 Tax=Anguilla anguilla TaxID=7936 RepID=A0A0E9RXK3_ANGAN